MPELPEVETIVRDIAPHLTGRSLRNPKIHKPDVLRGIKPAPFLRALARNKVTEVSRRAKHIVILLESGDRMVVQPRMTGSLVVYDRQLREHEKKYVVFQVGLGGKDSLVYRDVRRLGTISLLDEPSWNTYTARIGPEPLEDGFDSRAFAKCMKGTKTAIKKALMDQRRIAGVGNIYANEALFRAGIDPSRPASSVSYDEAKKLHRSVRHVLRASLRARGTTVRDYRTGTGGKGGYQHTLLVYGRGGQPCRRCRTRLTRTHSIDGRATTFCWRCQRLPVGETSKKF